MAPNPYLLAADNSPDLLPLLREDPTIASKQDKHGYSLLHAAASYNHISLARALVREFGVDVNMRDEDGETCLFVTETVAMATCLVEELHLDTSLTSDEGLTAAKKIEEEGEFVDVASYLRGTSTANGEATSGTSDIRPIASSAHPPSIPSNVTMDIRTMETETDEPDPEFKRRIDELAAKDDFRGEDRQRELRALITDAVRGVATDERETRRRL